MKKKSFGDIHRSHAAAYSLLKIGKEKADAMIKEWIVSDDEMNIFEVYGRVPTDEEKRKALIMSLAHLRLQQNGHDKEEALKFGEVEADKYLNNLKTTTDEQK